MAERLSVHTIPTELRPYRQIPGMPNYFITSAMGGKVPYLGAVEIGPAHWVNGELARRMGEAEDVYHAEHGDGIIGPAEQNGIPYSLMIAHAKVAATLPLLRQVNACSGRYISHDASYAVVLNPEHSFSIHKPKAGDRREQEQIVQLLYHTAQSGEAHIVSTAGIGIYRKEIPNGRPEVVELYTIETDLGVLRPDFDMGRLIQHLDAYPQIALGTKSPEVVEHFTRVGLHLPVTFTRYADVHAESVLTGYPPVSEGRRYWKTESSTDTGYNVHIAGLGLLK